MLDLTRPRREAGAPVTLEDAIPARSVQAAGRSPSWGDLLSLARRILRYADVRVPRAVFLRKLSHLLLTASDCDALDLTRMKGGVLRYHCRAELEPGGELLFQSRSFEGAAWPGLDFGCAEDHLLAPHRQRVLGGRVRSNDPHATASGSFWCADLIELLAGAPGWAAADLSRAGASSRQNQPPALSARSCRSVAIIRFEIEEGNYGLLELRSRRPAHFQRPQVEFWECLAQFIGITIADRRARESLNRRINELSCLNELAQLALVPELPEDLLLERIAVLLPSAFPFPGRAQVALVTGDCRYGPAWPDGAAPDLTATFAAGEGLPGEIQVTLGGREEADFTTFERSDFGSLLDGLARQVKLLLERRRAAQDRERLQGQLRHADRLATIGQLAAGVAHELNEPLANILGFAQLVGNESTLPDQAARDLQRIEGAALRGREIVRKLLIFAHQMPARVQRVDLNVVVQESLELVAARCARQGIDVLRDLARSPLHLVADPAQLQQVLVNLAVNAIQAMEQGGRLTVATRPAGDAIELTVADSGTGMSEEVQRQIFLPFYTTKEIGQGTGLGLAVVHGIVTAHGGRIDVASQVGEGSCFTVRLPAGELRGGEAEPEGE
jgi:two-component system NtrC family sensor kinase